jgi:signal transduction histidine kinase
LQPYRHLARLDNLFKHSRALVWTSALVLLAAVSLIDYFTGTEVSLSIFYLIPIILVAWYVGLRAGAMGSVIGAVLWFIMDSLLGEHHYLNPATGYWNSLVRFGFFIIVAVILSRLNHSLKSIRSRTEELALAYAELDRIRKEQLIMKDQILSHVSHELRTPLTAVHEFTVILRDGLAGPVNEEQKEYLQIALKNIKQLNRMIEDLIESAKVDAHRLQFNPERVSFRPVLDEVLRTLRSVASEKKISLTTDVLTDLPALHADPDRVRQVMLNLLDNALRFTPERGTITIRAGVFDQAPAFVCISVTDTGPGISPEIQKRLFQRLYQGDEAGAASRKGLGLGLYICKEIVSRHKGKIWVTSQPGQGSTFYFTLPVFLPNPEAVNLPGKEVSDG